MNARKGKEVKRNDELSEIKESLDSLHSLLTYQNKFRVFKIEDDNPNESRRTKRIHI